MSEPPATLDPLTPRLFLWGWPIAALASGAATYGYVASDLDPSELTVTAAGWILVAFLAGSAWRWRRWRDVHVSWRAPSVLPSPPPELPAPLSPPVLSSPSSVAASWSAASPPAAGSGRRRVRGSVGRDDRIAWSFAVGLALLTLAWASAALTPDGPPLSSAVVFAAADGLCWILATGQRIVVTPTRVSVRSLLGRTEIPRPLVAAFTTRSAAPYPMADSYIRIDLGDGTPLHFNTGPTVVGRNAPAGLLNLRPPKIRVARRLARLLDEVPVGGDALGGATVRRHGRPWVAALLAVFSVVGVGAFVALLATAS